MTTEFNSKTEIREKIHKVSLYLLLTFDRFCKENDLIYFLDSGTALGAVRHGGFIPWDDDVDVGMPRKDYERLLKIGPERLPEDLFIQTVETDPAYKFKFAKLRLKGTIYQEYDSLPFKENGFFIDIFPYDQVSCNKGIAKLDVTISSYMYHIIRLWRSSGECSTKILRLIQRLIKKIPESKIEWLDAMWTKYCRKNENKETGCMTPFFWGMSQYKAYIFDTNKMLPVRDILFEGHLLKIMRDPDYYLKLAYGDYLTLPPIAKRQGHHFNGMIDFGKYSHI